MKRLSFILLSSAFLLLNACKKDDNSNPSNYQCTTCVQTPEANATFDNNSGGVYKGVIVGSTGTIALYLFNTGTEVKALVSFDGQNATLTTTSLSGWAPGQAISNALFTGVVNGDQVQALFSVDANGQNPSVQVMIPGHSVVVSIYKETSTTLIKNFEGTYSGEDNGIFNMVFSGNDFSIVSDGGGAPVESTLVNNEINFTSGGVEIKGTFQGPDQMSGTWNDTNNNRHGTWMAHRTL